MNKCYAIFMHITLLIAAILVFFQVVAFLNILAYPTPMACLAMDTTPIALLAAATSAWAGGGALAALNLIEIYELCLRILLQGLLLIHQINLEQHNHMELVVLLPPGIIYRLKRVRCLVGHHHSFWCTHAPLLEVDLLGFSPVVPICVVLDLVLENCLHYLVEQVDLDIGFQVVLASHYGANVLHCEKEQVNRTAPPDCVAILQQCSKVSALLWENAVHIELHEDKVSRTLGVK